jgi:hypothetical protein
MPEKNLWRTTVSLQNQEQSFPNGRKTSFRNLKTIS